MTENKARQTATHIISRLNQQGKINKLGNNEHFAHSNNETPNQQAGLPPQEQINKAGIIPFIIENNKIYIYLYKPRARKPKLGRPGFQIAKGTRDIQTSSGNWVAYNPNLHAVENAETLLTTALREAIEEIGLQDSNIQELLEWGGVEFQSASTGNSKYMWLYLAKLNNKHDFKEPDTQHADTEECRWFDIDNPQEMQKLRADHKSLIQNIAAVMRKRNIWPQAAKSSNNQQRNI